ncbi:MAG TPA: glycosyltransferase family 4 protein [Thermoanaerobaculia bacterium]|nr:glycosyltransferase family 4 protein [Thermoanaerobaculia bacterium]
MKPRVAVVYPIAFGPEGIFGGGERYAVELARALAARTPTRLITFGPTAREIEVDGLEIHTYEPFRLLRGEQANPFTVGFLRSLRGMDVVHCTAWNTLVTDVAIGFARATGKRAFVTDVGGGASLTLHRFLPIDRWVHRYLLIAEVGGAEFLAHRERWRIIWAGIDTEKYRPPERPERRGVLFVGRLLPHKGIDVLIRAVGRDTPLTIVGRPYHGAYFRLLQQLAAGKDVRFVTDASDEQVIRCYQQTAVAVLPSVNRTVYGDTFPLPELLGFAAMEAMACGAATICTRVGGLGELMVDGETGFLVPPGDPVVLRQRISELLGDPELAERLGRAARRRIEGHFTWAQVAERCLAAYRS